MNREIKFRGQQINTKKWIHGYLYREKGLYLICENIRYAEKEPILLDTVGQFTGLHDKNGKEIYEGDAWEDEDGYYIIVWDEKEAGFLVDTYGFEEWLGEGGQECYGNKIEFISREPIDYFDFSKIEITKNIYDNPDLLEKGAEE